MCKEGKRGITAPRVAVLIAVALIVAPVSVMAAESPVVDSGSVAVRVNGNTENVVSAVREQDVIVMEARKLAEVLGVAFRWSNADGGRVRLTGGDTVAVFTAGSESFTLNGARHTLPVAASLAGAGSRDLRLPVRTVSEAFGAFVVWNGAAQSVSVFAPPTFAQADTAAVRITYDEALRQMHAASTSLQNLAESVRLIDRARDDLERSLNEVLLTLPTNPQTMMTDETAWAIWQRNNHALAAQREHMPLNERIIKENSEFALRRTVVAMRETKLDIALLQENIALTEASVRNLRLRHTVGMASDSDVRQAEQGLEQSRSNLVILETALLNTRNALNGLLGAPSGQATEVVLDAEMERLAAGFNLDRHVRTRIESDPQIRLMEEEVRQAQLVLDTTYHSITNFETERVRAENDLNATRRRLNDTRQNMDRALRNSFNTLSSLRDTRAAAEAELERMHAAYRDMVARYEAGVVTAAEVNQSRLGILRTESEIERIIARYASEFFAFHRPHLLI